MDKKLSDEEVMRMADDIDKLYRLHDDHRRTTRALEAAVLAILDTLEGKFLNTGKIVVTDLRQMAEKERKFMKYRQETDPDSNITDEDIETEVGTLENLILKLERRMISD